MAANDPALEKTTEYTVVLNLHHGGKLYRPGSKVKLAAKNAADLMKSGVVAEIPAKK